MAKALECPWCRSENLHHMEVLVYARPKEDGPSYRHFVSAVSPAVSFPSKLDGEALSENPSPRRSAVSVNFFCEMCPGLSRLDIWQHKGETHIAMRRTGRDDTLRELEAFACPPF